MFKQLYNSIIDLIYPRICCNCDNPVIGSEKVYICPDCAKDIDIIDYDNSCSVCSRPLETKNPYINICADCRDDKKKFLYNKSFFLFTGVVKKIVHECKFRKNPKIIYELFNIIREYDLLNRIHLEESDYYFVPIPMNKYGFKKRGFNQTFLIAEFLKEIFSFEIIYDALIKSEDTLTQSTLKKYERLKYIKGKYITNKNYSFIDKNVILIDDVYTTGATISECSRVLKKSGCNKIISITLCRGF